MTGRVQCCGALDRPEKTQPHDRQTAAGERRGCPASGRRLSAAVFSNGASATIRTNEIVMHPMWYAIIGTDEKDSLPRRRAVRPAHLERLQRLAAEGRLLVAGPFPAVDTEDPGDAGFTGSLIVAEFTDLAAARSWAEADPYVIERVYRDIRVAPFRKVLP
jgi:uncharacterized protein YciI